MTVRLEHQKWTYISSCDVSEVPSVRTSLLVSPVGLCATYSKPPLRGNENVDERFKQNR